MKPIPSLLACFLLLLPPSAWSQLPDNTTAPTGFNAPNFPIPTFDQSRQYNVKDFGATGGGSANDTAAIDKAIAKCNADGGGVVTFPAGTYMVASIHIMSNVELQLDDAAIIKGMDTGYDPPEPNPYDKYQDFGHSHFHTAVMWGENIQNFAIVGGMIDGGGITHGTPKPNGGDKQIAIVNGTNLLFKGLKHHNGGHFVFLLNNCQNVNIWNNSVDGSRDAIDLMGCSNVQVHGCNFVGCGDDTLGIKSDYALGKRINSANIFAWDDYFESGCNGLQFGSETAGDFDNIWIWNIRIGKAGKAGIGITSCDSAVITNVHYRDITIKNAASPIFLLVTDRLRTGEPGAKPGAIRNVTITNVTSTEPSANRQGPVHPCTIMGLPDAELENIVLQNVNITYKGGGTQQDAARNVPYLKKYSPNDYGIRPAAGLFVRNVKGLELDNVTFSFEADDQRPVVVASNVDGLILNHFTSPHPSGVPLLKLDQIQNLKILDSPELQNGETPSVDKTTLPMQ